MATTLRQLAELIGAELHGDPELEIRRVYPIDLAEEGDITFVANAKYASKLQECRASAVIVSPDLEVEGMNLLVTSNPYLAFAKVLTFLQGPAETGKGVLPGAIVADSAELDESVTVHPGAVIGENVKIGPRTIIHPGVVLYAGVTVGADCLLHAGSIVRDGCRLGDRVVLQPSAVVGSDGFGFAPDGSSYYKIPQVGIVVIDDDVELGACCCIDRAALGETRVGRGTKLDNMVHIAHNVEVGEDCILVGQVGIAGSTKIGKHCTFGGQAGAVGHINIGDNVTVVARAAVTSNADSNQVLAGFPTMPHKQWLKMATSLPKVTEMRKEMQQMKKRLEQLESLLKEK